MSDSDENTTPTNDDTKVQETEDKNNDTSWLDGEFDAARAKAKIEKTNAEAASLRARLKEAQEKAAKYDAAQKAEEDAKKSEADKFAELSAKHQELQRKLWQTEIREETGLTAAQMKYVTGDSLEELKANAEAFKQEVLGASKEEEFEMTEEEIEAASRELSPLGGNRRTNNASRARATSTGVGDPAFDAEKLAAEIMKSPWG